MTDLHRLLEDYVATRHAMGYKLQHVGRRLLEFVDLTLTRGSFITTKLALEWATKPADASPKWWAARLRMVRQFALYAHAFDARTQVPPCHLIADPRQRPRPYIYLPSEIDGLLHAARAQPGSLVAATDTTLIGLLAVTGMRVSEAIKLDRGDLDRDQGLIVVRESKFRKSRELPLHPSTVEALVTYARARDRLLPIQRSSRLFLSTVGKPLLYKCLRVRFHRLVDGAGLADRSPRRPRIHDLRHTFAVQTLIRWYRAGLDVEPRLPLLSTYLGHLKPAATYWYLTAVPELLALVCDRGQRAHEVQP